MDANIRGRGQESTWRPPRLERPEGRGAASPGLDHPGRGQEARRRTIQRAAEPIRLDHPGRTKADAGRNTGLDHLGRKANRSGLDHQERNTKEGPKAEIN